MPQALRIDYPHLDLERAQDQVRAALERAFTYCGSQRAFIERMHERMRGAGEKLVTKQAVSWWYSEGTFVDRRYWPHFEEITDMGVTRRHLAPHVYGLLEEQERLHRRQS